MKKLDRKGLFKIISATSMVIFSLVVSFSGAIAWYNATRKVDQNTDDFVVQGNASIQSVYIVPFLGVSADENYFTFDIDHRVTAYSKAGGQNDPSAVMLNQYSLDNPDHPIFMLFEVEGVSANITFKTDYCFLGNNRIASVTSTYATKAALDNAARSFDGNQTGNYYRVTEDEDHGDVTTVYSFDDGRSEKLKMEWIDLGDAEDNETNPLSSVVEFHYFTFAQELAGLSEQKSVLVEHYNPSTGVYTYGDNSGNPTNESCLAIQKSSITNGNRRSFTRANNDDTYSFNNALIAYDGDVNGKHFVGIMINYDSQALEYIFSVNLGHNALNAGLDFVCDWKTEF